ncbi:MAG: polynucleotide adenylyltransferase PcnB, partial [Planctomycetota bacterium]|nr:polynucleotide adenylyltransferase PcnB [Planctomycetota bacterium]
RENHNISRRDIDADALKVLYRLARNNHTAYLVGGGVRDLLLRRQPKDFDISTNARPEQIKTLFKNCLLIGRRFRLAHIRYGDKIIETSTFRRAPVCEADPNDPDADLFQRDDNLFGSPEEDALRRDFTVNGLFYDIESFSVIDYVGGVEDLAKRRIRAIGDPGIRFREDPVRMVRAVRFASRLEFAIEEETLAALIRHREEIAKASPARLLEEIARLFAFSSGERAVRLLHSTGVLGILIPEVQRYIGETPDAEPFWRRIAALDRGDTVLPDATQAVIFGTLLTDPIRFALKQNDSPSNPGRSVERIRSYLSPIAQRLKFPRKLTDRITRVLLAQSRLLTPGKKRFSPAGMVQQDWFQEALALTEINAAVDGSRQEVLNQWRVMLADRLYARDDSRTRSPQGGKQRRREAQREEREDEETADADGDESPGQQKAAAPGLGMSRSARRRRNRQKNREKRLAEEKARLEHEAELPRDPVVPIVETLVTEANAGSAQGKRKRGRGRNQPLPPRIEQLSVEGPAGPLTAAAFYMQPRMGAEKEAEPEKTKPAKREKKERNGDRRINGMDREKPEKAQDARTMDLAEEADIPINWLDEI